MSVTLTKNFWNSGSSIYTAISKIVFTSPNIDSPAAAGTRSYILPGSSYIGLWYESISQMYRMTRDQNPPNKQETYFQKLFINQQNDFNFNTDHTLSVRTPYLTTFTTGQVLNYNRDEYCVISTTTSGGTVSFGGTNLGSFFEDYPLDGPTYSDGTYIYRIKINTTSIYRYDITNNYWIKFIDAPDLFTVNASFVKMGNILYCIKGSENIFWKYDIITNTWTNLKNIPTVVDSYSYIDSFDGTTILFMKAGVGTGQTIYEYDISLNSWTTFFTPSLPSYTQTWYGPAFFKYDDKYYTWACTKLGSTASIRYVQMDVGGLSTSIVGSSLYDFTTGAGGIGNVSMFGSGFTDVAATYSGTDIYKVLGHFYVEVLPGVETGFINAIHYADGYDVSGIHLNTHAGCFSRDDLSFSPSIGMKPDVASITSDSSYFYISERKPESLGKYLYRYDLLVSGTSNYSTTSCSITNSVLSGESVFTKDTSNIYYSNNKLYSMEGTSSNSLWTYDTISGTLNNTFGYSNITISGTDRNFITQPYSCLCSDSSTVYTLKGKDYDSFYKLTTSGTWTQLEHTPALMCEYGSMVYVSTINSIYVIQGKNSNALWRYDISSNQWYIRQGSPSVFTDKCVLHYPIYGGNYIYAIKGENYNNFWRYSIVSNSWESLSSLITYDKLAYGLTSRGTDTITGKLYSINDINVYEYSVNTNSWGLVDGTISYSDDDKKFTSNGNGGNIYILGSDGIRSFELDSLSDIGSQYAYNLTFSSVVGTSVVGTDESFYSWKNGIANSSVWSNSQTSIIFEVTNGEAYNCRLTAWDDETHSTTNNKILSEEHYKVVCAAYRAYSGTKSAPMSNNKPGALVFPAGIDIPLKGNSKYYGDFDLIHIANGGITGTELGEYLIFTPRLHNMDDSFVSGNYDFVTTLHYQYT